MTDIPRGQGGDGSPQLDLDAIEREHTRYGEACENCKHQFPYDDCVACGETWPCSASQLVALVRRLQQENEELRDEAEERGERAIRYGREARLAEEQVEELTEALRALLTDAFVDDVFTMEAQRLTASERKARALLARVVPEKETP